MSFLTRTLFVALVLGSPLERASAQSMAGCAPSGSPTPHLSVRQAGTRTLRLENGPASGRAYFLARLPHVPGSGPARPAAAGCVAEAHGSLLFGAQLDSAGVFETPLSAYALAARPTLSAVVVPPGASLAQAALSNSVSIGPFLGRDAELPGSTPGSGVVVITEFMKDPAAVADTVGEWIELYNPGSTAVDIEGWVLSDLGSDSVALLNGGQGIVVPANGFLVLGRNDDPAVNGGVAVDFVISGMTLSNGDDEIVLSLPDGTVVDEVHYDDGTLWPEEAGRSASLDLAAFDVVSNDDPANWCLSSTPLSPGSTDTGTPGLANDACVGG